MAAQAGEDVGLGEQTGKATMEISVGVSQEAHLHLPPWDLNLLQR